MSILKTIWRKTGNIAYFLLIPAIKVYALVTKPRARVLLVHNNHALVVKNWLGGTDWSLPGGGLEFSESAIHAAVREVQEELGIVVEISALQDFGEYTSTEKLGLRSKHYLFGAVLPERPRLTIREREIVDVQWVPLTELLAAQKGVSNSVQNAIRVWIDSSNLVSY